MKSKSNGRLKLDPRNARKHGERNQKMIADSLQELGAGRSILVDAGDTIIAGNGVYEQAQKLGLKVKVIESDGKTLYAIKRKDLNGARARRMALLDNRSTETSEWDSDVLAQIAESERELLEGLFDDKELREIIGKGEPQPEPVDAGELIDKAAELQKKWQVKRGDIWEVGKHRLMCGDSTSKEDVKRLMRGEKFAVLFTDPPYGISYDTTATGRSKRDLGAVEGDKLRGQELEKFNAAFLANALTHSCDNATFYVCGANRTAHHLILAAESLHIHYAVPIVWVKNHFSLNWDRYHPQHEMIFYGGEGSKPTGNSSRWFGSKNESTVWQIQTDASQKYEHPTQKPVALPLRAIQNSANFGEIVLDLFCGSGSTLAACEMSQCVGYGMELTERFCAVTLERLTNLGLTAKRVERGNGKAR